MKIGFDAKRAFHNFRGLGNYSRNLIHGLSEFYPQHEYFLYTPPVKDARAFAWRDQHTQLKICEPEGLSRKFSSLWRSRFVVGDISRDQVDIFHGLSHELPHGIARSGAKSVVTVHDLLFLRFPQFHKPVDRYFYKKKLDYACGVADCVVAVSQQTKRDIVEFLKVPEERIKVVYQSCDARFFADYSQEDDEQVRVKHNLPDDFLLYVGALTPGKNLIRLLEAYAVSGVARDMKLVIAGEGSAKGELVEKIDQLGLVQSVMLLGFIPNTELAAFYRLATVFVYPSLFEGFGIPIIEALSSGTPVLTSTDSCFSEAGGEGGYYVEPTDVDAIAAGMVRLVSDAGLREQLVVKGREHVQQFRSVAVTRDMMNVYQALAG